jgi:tetratricopeptide (TPR) repeat protein
LLSDQGKLSEAEPLYREALRGRQETLGETHRDTLASLNNLAVLLKSQGKLSEAEPLFREALLGQMATLGETHPDTLASLNNLANLLSDQGKLSEPEPLYREALRGRQAAGRRAAGAARAPLPLRARHAAPRRRLTLRGTTPSCPPPTDARRPRPRLPLIFESKATTNTIFLCRRRVRRGGSMTVRS